MALEEETGKTIGLIDLGLRDDGGVPVVNSRVVAEAFEKRHDNVLRDIDNILGSSELRNLAEQGVMPFREVYVFDEKANKNVRTFDMTRDGFTLLAMGWTGDRAMTFKVRYIEAFNAMEAKLRAMPVDSVAAMMAVLSDPAKALALIGDYATRLLAANAKTEQVSLQRDEATARAETLAVAHDRFASHEGTFNVTVAAKTLKIAPSKLFNWLAANGWIYRPGGRGSYVAYQTKIHSELIVHATHEIKMASGEIEEKSQVRLTTKGLDKIALSMGLPPVQVPPPASNVLDLRGGGRKHAG